MGGETDGGRGVGEKMKDIENVEDKKMSEEETRRLFISLYNKLQLKNIKGPIYKGIGFPGWSKLLRTTAPEPLKSLKDVEYQNQLKDLYTNDSLSYLKPLLYTEYLDYFMYMYDMFINTIIKKQYIYLRKKYNISITCNEEIEGFDEEYDCFLKDYRASRGKAKKETDLFFRQMMDVCGDEINNKYGFYETLTILKAASIDSAFVGENNEDIKEERCLKKSLTMKKLYSHQNNIYKEIKIARSFIDKYNIYLPLLYILVNDIRNLCCQYSLDDLIDCSIAETEKCEIYKRYCQLPIIYKDMLNGNQTIGPGVDQDDLLPFFRNSEFDYIMNKYNTALLLTELPFKNIQIRESFDKIIKYCKLASPKMLSELIEKYKIEKKITYDTEIYRDLISKSTFERIRKGKYKEKPQKSIVILLTIGLRLTFEEAKNFIEVAGHSLDKNETSDNPELISILKYILKITNERKLTKSNKENIVQAINFGTSYKELKRQLQCMG